MTVYGIYPHREAAQEAVGELKAEGFRNADFSVLLANTAGSKDFAQEQGTAEARRATVWFCSQPALAGFWRLERTMRIPGLGPFVAAGPITGLSPRGGAGALDGLGIPKYEAKRYEGRIRKGGILVSVHAEQYPWTKKAQRILKETGAEDIASAS